MSDFNFSLLLKESSPSKHNTNISSIQFNDKAMLQSLLKEFRDVFPDDLPPGLPHERTQRMVFISTLAVNLLVNHHID